MFFVKIRSKKRGILRKKNILILDDDERICEELGEYLIRKKYKVYSANRPSSAFRILEKSSIDILFLDLILPEMDGIHVLKKIKRLFPKTDVIMISGNDNMLIIKEAKRMGAIEYLIKPFLHTEVKKAIETLRMAEENFNRETLS